MHRHGPEHAAPLHSSLTDLLGQWLLAFILSSAVQALWHAQGAEFWHADDGAHYVSSAMVANWLTAGLSDGPLTAALDYNAHYPLVGVGLWGPAFYVIFGAVIAILGPGQTVALVLTAVVMASLATVTSWMVSRVANRGLAWLAAPLFVVLPLSVDQSLSFGLDAPVALAMCVAMLAIGGYLLQPRTTLISLSVVAAVVGLLTKGNALALYLYAPLVLLLVRRAVALRDWRIWAAVALITLFAVPWYIFSYRLAASGFRATWGWAFTSQALLVNPQLLYAALGPWLALLSIWGAVRSLMRAEWGTVFVASSLSVFLFQSIVPASLNARYLLPMFPFVLALAALGWVDLHQRVPARWRIASALGAIGVLVLTTATLSYPHAKKYHGIGGAAAQVRTLLPYENRSVLIVGFDVVEAAFISEMAMRKPIAPDVFVLRGSRLLGGGGYNNFEYQPLFQDSDSVEKVLNAYRVPLVVISHAERANNWLHIAQVQSILDLPSSGWRRVWQSDGEDHVHIYMNDANAAQPLATVMIKNLSMPRRTALPPNS